VGIIRPSPQQAQAVFLELAQINKARRDWFLAGVKM
jgi:hypothetical protein